jgi:hypothetical protein
MWHRRSDRVGPRSELGQIWASVSHDRPSARSSAATFCTLSPAFGIRRPAGKHVKPRARPCRSCGVTVRAALRRSLGARRREVGRPARDRCAEDVAVVAGEQLVAAVTAEAHGEMFAAARHSNAVGSIDGSANGSSQMAGSCGMRSNASASERSTCLVIGSEMSGDRGRVLRLVEAEFGHRDGERPKRASGCARCASAETSEESIPPDRNAPSGTSLSSRIATASARRRPSSPRPRRA